MKKKSPPQRHERRGAAAPAATSPLLDGRSALVLVAVLGAVFGLHRLIDPDLFVHLAVGRAILADPRSLGISNFIDAYPAYPYVEDKWLGCVAVAAFHALGGIDGVMLYQIAICITVAVAWYAMQRAWGASPAVGVVGVGLGLLTCGFRLEPRPDTLSHALLAATITITVAPAVRPRLRWLVPLLFALWINLHSYFVNGLLVLLAAAIASMLGDRTPGVSPRGRDAIPTRERWLLLALAVGACLLHPQGWRAALGPFELLLMTSNASYQQAITELQPSLELLRGAGPAQWLVLGAPFALAVAVGITRAGRSALLRQGLALAATVPWIVWPPARMDALEFRITMALLLAAAVEVPTALRERRLLGPLLLAGFTMLAIPLVRNLPLITAAALIVLAPAWTELGRALLAARPSAWSRRLSVATLVACVLGVGWLRLSDRMNTAVRAPSRTGWGVEADRFPVGAADFIAKNRLPGLLLNTFDFGGYLLYRLHPERRVYIAGNTVMYPLSFLLDYVRRVTGPEVDLTILVRERDVRTAVIDLTSPASANLMARLAASPDWRLVFLDHAAAVYTLDDGLPALALETRVAELLQEEHFHPGLPSWLGGKALSFPSANLPNFLDTIGRPDLALAAVDQLWPVVPSRALAVLAGSAAMKTGRIASRVGWLEDALTRYPGAADLRKLAFFAHSYAVEPLFARGALPEAEQHLRRMVELQPTACGPYAGLAKTAVLAGDSARAREMLAESARRDADGTCLRQMAADPLLAPLSAR